MTPADADAAAPVSATDSAVVVVTAPADAVAAVPVSATDSLI